MSAPHPRNARDALPAYILVLRKEIAGLRHRVREMEERMKKLEGGGQ